MISMDITARKKMEEELKKTTYELSERNKELKCLYNLSRLAEKAELSMEEFLQATVNIIPQACRYPENTCARIVMGEREYRTPNFRQTGWELAADIFVDGEKPAVLKVYQLENKTGKDEDAFLKEEKVLLNAVAERLGKTIECGKLEEELRNSEQQFKGILSSVTDRMSLIDERYNVVWANDAAKHAFGPGLSGKKCYAAYHRRRKACDLCPVASTFADGKVHEQELTVTDVHGIKRIYWCVSSAAKYRKYDRPKLAVEVSRDITARRQMEVALKTSERQLQQQKSELERKDLALGEIIAQIEIEKNRVKEDTAANVKNILMPLLQTMRTTQTSHGHIALLQHAMKDLASAFGREMIKNSSRLTPREIEICNMIRSGLISKEIAGHLSLSYQTIERHRKNIRKKINISNKDVNLTSFLQKI